jgi:type VI secretion system protein ImpE
MGPEEYLRAGNVEPALKELQDQIRRNPADPKLRIFLFQLLAIEGQWDRANKQLAVCGELDAGALSMVQTYREALKCEMLRAEIFGGGRTPLIFGQPERWIALLIEALKHQIAGDIAHSQALRDEAFAQAPATSGTIDGEAFVWLADADIRLGPILEVIVAGRYWWVPFQRIQRIVLDPPVDLRDLVWVPAELTWANGGNTVALIPVRYPGTEKAADPALRLSRKTDWQDQGSDMFQGLGQRILATDGGEYPLSEIRELVLNPALDDEAAPEIVRDGH